MEGPSGSADLPRLLLLGLTMNPSKDQRGAQDWPGTGPNHQKSAWSRRGQGQQDFDRISRWSLGVLSTQTRGTPPLSVAVFTRSWAPTLALAWERTEAPQAVETCQFSSPEGGSDSSPGFEEKFCFSGESFFMSDPSTKHDRKKADSLFKGLVDFTH